MPIGHSERGSLRGDYRQAIAEDRPVADKAASAGFSLETRPPHLDAQRVDDLLGALKDILAQIVEDASCVCRRVRFRFERGSVRLGVAKPNDLKGMKSLLRFSDLAAVEGDDGLPEILAG